MKSPLTKIPFTRNELTRLGSSLAYLHAYGSTLFEGPAHREMALSMAPPLWRKLNNAYARGDTTHLRLRKDELSLINLSLKNDLGGEDDLEARSILLKVQPHLLAA